MKSTATSPRKRKGQKALYVQLDEEMHALLERAVENNGTTIKAYVTAALCAFDPTAVLVPDEQATYKQLYAISLRNEMHLKALEPRLAVLEKALQKEEQRLAQFMQGLEQFMQGSEP